MPNKPPLRFTPTATAGSVVKGEQHSLVCVLNDSSKPVTYEFRLPVELGHGYEYYSGRRGEAITLTPEPGEVGVYVLQP